MGETGRYMPTSLLQVRLLRAGADPGPAMTAVRAFEIWQVPITVLVKMAWF